MKTKRTIYCLVAYLAGTLCASLLPAKAIDEVNAWRKANGLPAFQEDAALTKFAQMKAEYRAARLLKDGHQGPRCPSNCREGTAEAEPWWGWLSCCMEESGKTAGAGVAIGEDGERYMVLVVRGTRGTALSRRIRPLKTAHMTPDAPIIKRIKGFTAPQTKRRFYRKRMVSPACRT